MLGPELWDIFCKMIRSEGFALVSLKRQLSVKMVSQREEISRDPVLISFCHWRGKLTKTTGTTRTMYRVEKHPSGRLRVKWDVRKCPTKKCQLYWRPSEHFRSPALPVTVLVYIRTINSGLSSCFSRAFCGSITRGPSPAETQVNLCSIWILHSSYETQNTSQSFSS